MAKTPNLGEAVSLQYQFPRDNFALQEITRRKQEEDEAIGAARKAHAAGLANIDKYKADTDKWLINDASGIIAPLQPEVKAKTAELFDYIKQQQRSNPNYNIYGDDQVRKIKFELGQVVDKNKISSKAYLDDVEKAVRYPDLFEIDTQFTDAAGKGSFDDWMAANDKISGKPAGTGIYTYGAIKPKEDLKQVDWRKSLFNYSNQAGKVRNEEGAEYVPESTKQKLFEGWKNTPDYKSAVAEYGSTLPLDKVDKMIYENDWKPLFSATAAPKKAEKGGLSIGIGGAKSGKFYYNVTPTTKKVGRTTGTYKTPIQGESVDMVFGQEGATALPTAQFVDDNEKPVIGKPTGKIKNTGTYDKPILVMEMLVVKKNSQGLFDAGSITPETNPDKFERVFVPLTKSKENKAKFQGEYSEDNSVDIDVLYGEIKGEKESGKKTELTTEEWNKQWGALKKGQSMVGLDGKTYTKK